ncbi:MAG: HAD-IB family phosphatase [candidate division Zixibacteria bacterium]|nr:HAD-IB family phosphatase [candidate division Zixibacteria bacterium]
MTSDHPQSQRIDSVIFDCDSTLSSIEGVDELAERAGVGDDIRTLTKASMEGDVNLEDVYGKRLELIRPNTDDLAWLGLRYVEAIVDGAGHAIATIQVTGRAVYIVSGGILQALHVLARELKVPQSHVFGVAVHLSEDGSYAGYDTDAPTAHSGGKTEIIRGIIANGRRAVMIGDGVTDLEAQRLGVPVIGFGGVVTRPAVKAQADAWVDGPSLLGVLAVIEALEMS